MIAPLKNYTITDVFGANQSWRKFPHTGLDMISADRTVYAPEDGTISTAVWTDGGNVAFINSGNRRHEFYHLASWTRRSGTVKQGEPIAVFGSTGNVRGAHLHWTLKINGTRVDPLKYISKPTGDEPMIVRDADNWYGRIGKLMTQVRGRTPSRAEFKQNLTGIELLTAVEILSDHPDANQQYEYSKLGRRAEAEKWQEKIVSNTAQQKLVDALNIEVLNLKKAIEDDKLEDKRTLSKLASAEKAVADAKAKIDKLEADTEQTVADGSRILRLIGDLFNKLKG